ncbi:hypothetical protein MMC10_010851 [Thelotrema lepadinum]|nr:hypothetical protein [Thelotrema lepadinum]
MTKLLALPPSVRELIWVYALQYDVSLRRYFHWESPGDPGPASLLCVSHALHDECAPTFYSINSFFMRVPPNLRRNDLEYEDNSADSRDTGICLSIGFGFRYLNFLQRIAVRLPDVPPSRFPAKYDDDTESEESNIDSEGNYIDSDEHGTDSDEHDTDSDELGTDSDEHDTDSDENATDSDEKKFDSDESNVSSDKSDTGSNKSDVDVDENDTNMDQHCAWLLHWLLSRSPKIRTVELQFYGVEGPSAVVEPDPFAETLSEILTAHIAIFTTLSLCRINTVLVAFYDIYQEILYTRVSERQSLYLYRKDVPRLADYPSKTYNTESELLSKMRDLGLTNACELGSHGTREIDESWYVCLQWRILCDTEQSKLLSLLLEVTKFIWAFCLVFEKRLRRHACRKAAYRILLPTECYCLQDAAWPAT